MERLKGKVAIVTGGGSGIGKAIALRLAQDGAAVVIADLQNFELAAAEIAKATGSATLGLQIDVASEKDAKSLADETAKRRAMPSPNPEPPPVTIATLSLTRIARPPG